MALIRVDEAMKPGLKKGLDRLTPMDQAQLVERSQKSRGAKMEPSKWTNVLIKEAISIAKRVGADAILFYMDSTQDLRPFYKIKSDTKLILLTKRRECIQKASQVPLHAVLIPDVRLTRSGYLNVSYHGEALPQGLGTRHTAAAAITQVTDSVALTISESTGKVTLFRGGKIITVIDKAPFPSSPKAPPA